MKPALGLALLVLALQLPADALQSYVARPDPSYRWTPGERLACASGVIDHLQLASQTWRGHLWTHHIRLLRPKQVRNADIAFLFIGGDGEGDEQLAMLHQLAERAGALAAVVTAIPNQPFYAGRREDALIAYSLDRYLHTGDTTWPLLFPMVKSAVRAMDAVQAFAQERYGQRITRFVLAGASKRGWTTWLTAAVDARVHGIAPMVFDMLNISAQTEWARKVYGQQSAQLHEYTDLGLVREDETPRMTQLRRWIDPYTYRVRYTMPKLLLLGTNDAYWTVDAVRHYWQELPEPKLMFQTPNAGHDLAGGQEAEQSLAVFFQMIADGAPLPNLHWQFEDVEQGTAKIAVTVDRPVDSVRLWTADSQDRDFRNDHWTSRELAIQPGSAKASTQVPTPDKGYRAYLVEARLTASTGHSYGLSTAARVTPDDIR
ncbi:MAG: PhoPQ-activated protein PqaA family protein [Gammaproteobacteria bacterium]